MKKTTLKDIDFKKISNQLKNDYVIFEDGRFLNDKPFNKLTSKQITTLCFGAIALIQVFKKIKNLKDK